MFTAERGGLLMMISYKVKSNPLMASNNYGKINSLMLSSYRDKANLQMPSSNKDKISSPMTKAYRDKGNHLILNDFKINEGKALMINCQVASERRWCSYD